MYENIDPLKRPILSPEEDGEVPVLVDTSYFTLKDLELGVTAIKREGRDIEKMRITFSHRTDLSGQPWMLLFISPGEPNEQ